MMKLVILAVLVGISFRLLFGAWPWQAWARSERAQKEAQARVLLGVSHSADEAEIQAAHRRAMLDAHPDRGGSEQRVHEIDAARDILLEQTRSKNA